MKKFIVSTLLAFGMLASAASQASIIGHNVTCAVGGGSSFSCDQAGAVVGAGAEFGIGNMPTAYLSADFSANLLTVNVLANNSLTLTILNFSDLSSAFTAAVFLGQTGFNGLAASDVSLNSGILSVDLRGTSSTTGAQFQIELAQGTVPEPATLGLFGLALAGLAAASRRKQ